MHEGPIRREHYLKILHGLKDKPLVKIITGIRRCGKSTLMEMFISDLRKSGIPDENIMHMNFEDKQNVHITDWNTLLNEVTAKIELKKGTYLFFDEIQDVTGWEKAINTMRYSGADIYITGSSSKMLVSDFSTYLSGRYAKMEAYPLSFREYIDFIGGRKEDREQHLSEYLINGGMPLAVLERENEKNVSMILSSAFETVFIRDVVEKNKIMDVPTVRNIM
jgi:predicted AAA+ superfamily ATPase